MEHTKRSSCVAIAVLSFLLIGTSFIFCHETNGGNQPKTLVGEEPAKIITKAMYVDPEHPGPGDEFTLRFMIKNNSTATAEDLYATINLPVQLELVFGGKKVHLGSLGPDQERFVSWSIRANASGDFIIDLDCETSNLGTSQSRWLLEIFPRSIDVFLSPWFQLLAVIVIVGVVVLIVVFARKRSRRSRHFNEFVPIRLILHTPQI